MLYKTIHISDELIRNVKSKVYSLSMNLHKHSCKNYTANDCKCGQHFYKINTEGKAFIMLSSLGVRLYQVKRN